MAVVAMTQCSKSLRVHKSDTRAWKNCACVFLKISTHTGERMHYSKNATKALSLERQTLTKFESG
jgi:hypothetical protein